MSISYQKLWKILEDDEISHSELRKMTGIAPNTMTKLFRDEAVSMDVLIRICETLQADFGDIVEWIPGKPNE